MIGGPHSLWEVFTTHMTLIGSHKLKKSDGMCVARRCGKEEHIAKKMLEQTSEC